MRERTKHLLVKFDSRLPCWLRRLIRDKQWQQSARASVALWIVGTVIITVLAWRFGHKVRFNIGVGLTLGAVMYGLCRFRIFREGKAGYPTSTGSWLAIGVVFFFFNAGMAWLLMGKANLATIPARLLLGLIGIAVNPLRFWINSKIIFARWHFTLKPLRFSLNDRVILPRPARGTT